MSDRDWQHAVLRDLGAAGTGLADPQPPRTTPAPLAAPHPPAVPAPPPPAVPAPQPYTVPAPFAGSGAWYTEETVTDPEGTVTDPDQPIREAPTAPDAPAAPEIAQPSPVWGAAGPAERQSTATFSRPPRDPPRESPPAAEELPVVSYVGDVQAEAFGQLPEPAAPVAPGPPAAAGYAGPQMSAEALVRRNPHGDPLRRRMTRGMRKAVGASAAGDLRETTGIAERLMMPVPSCRRIAVTSIRGGAGKTTVAALLATVIAEHRGDRVLALDADSGIGSLSLRLAVRAERTMSDLAQAHPRSWDETAGFLARTQQGVWVLSGSADGQVSELELETFQAAAGGVSRYFSAAVIDCGAGIVARLQRGVLAAAHAQVFVTPGTADGALSARQALSWFEGSGYAALLSRSVVVLVAHSPHADGDADLDRARQVLSDGGLPVVVVPYDRHLSTGTAIDPARISDAVRTSATWIAAEVFARSLSGGA